MSPVPRLARALLAAVALFAAVATASGQQPVAPTAAPRAGTTRVSGTVFDSSARRPLATATVQVVAKADVARGPSFTVTTDASGVYRIDGVPPGDYVATFFHARLDTLGVSGPMVSFSASAATQVLDMAIPSANRLISLYCGPRQRGDSSGVILGEVRRADLPEPIANAMVSAQWFELAVGANGLVRSTPTRRARTAADGRYAICGVPWDAAVNVWALTGKASTGTVVVETRPMQIVARDLVIDLADTLAIADTSRRARGTATITGIVRSPSGAPLAGARVAVRGTTSESIADDRGSFSLTGLPAGTQTLEARAIGYVPVATAVTLSATRQVRHDIAFDSAARILETVNVRAALVYSRAEREFNAARRGNGFFIDRETIERRSPFRTTDLLRGAPGLSVYQGGAPGSGTTVTMRGISSLSNCNPMIVIDGMRFEGGVDDLDLLSRPEEIVGMAIYRGPSETPAEYQSMRSCGAIVIWTYRGARPNERSRRR